MNSGARPRRGTGRPRAGRGGRGGSAGRVGGQYRHGYDDGNDERGRHTDQNQIRNAERSQDGDMQHTGSTRPRRPRRLGYKSLEALLEEDPTELVFRLSLSQSGFVELLNESEIRRDIIALIINVISRACESTSATQNLVKLLNLTYEHSEFMTRHLTVYVTKIQFDSDPNYIVTVPKQIKNISTILMTMLQRLPSSKSHVNVIVTLLRSTILVVENRGVIIDDETKNILQRLVEYQQVLNREAEERSKPFRQRLPVGSTGPPPNDFRDVPIFPTVDDFNTDVKPYLRPNIVDGGYTSVDNYLDVQYRLLREDFVQPLRTGIKAYQLMKLVPTGQRNQRETDIRIYNDVRIEYPMCSWDGIIYRVHFDVTQFHRVRWQATKRLIFGSLVCLSKDNFVTLVFATVANRKPEDLEQGLVDLRFENKESIEEFSNDDKFVMAETSAYFEAYRHVLEGLQQITADTFPLQKYIIGVTKVVDAPEYLRKNPAVRYDLGPLVSESRLSDETEEKRVDKMNDDIDDVNTQMQRLQFHRRLHSATRASSVPIMNTRLWPSAKELHFDDSQLEAVQIALTKEFSVIQGPPGTGKTYIGLKIVQALLHNSRVWSNEDDGEMLGIGKRTHTRPLLIVCLTNHALDQFLEGILKFQKTNIVRIGGRSASEALKPYNLNILKQEIRKRREVHYSIHAKSRETITAMARCRQPMEVAQTRIAMTRHAILNEDNLRPYMGADHYDSIINFCPHPQNLQQIRATKMLTWLGLTGNFYVANNDDNYSLDMGNSKHPGEEMDIDEEADIAEEQRMLDDQDFADRDIHQKGYDVRNEFALDIDDMGIEEAPQDEYDWQQVKIRKTRLKQIIRRNLQLRDTMIETEAKRISNVWKISDMPTRWRLYRYWMNKYCKRQAGILYEKMGEYETLSVELKEIRTEEDLSILNRAKVIGMTTTGAAKYRDMLQRIKPRIIVVEEAAEVLESHIITTLSKDCQQLILIGDHQQLRPNPTVYELAKNFNLDISLFERMVKNGLPCQRLIQQHRMRPEISRIMKLSHFYPHLLDHDSVKQFNNIMGVASNVFFLDHDKLEANVDDTKSHSNQHEAEFLVSLSRYFLQQGYAPSQITILTTYTAQLFNFKRLMAKNLFKGIRVCAVDNFQGEENDIIMLSLVRSNEEGSIGFLKVANRVCVALSRARKGLFCIGNFSLLASKGQLWKDIVTEMKNNDYFGTRLKLVCHNHPETATEVSIPKDFLKVPEGGCSKPCETRLECGHACSMPCHPRDPEHVEYRCLKPCTKVVSGCPLKHRCKKSCYQECVKKCTTRVEKFLPCGHISKVPCFQDVKLVVCQEPCLRSLSCGHSCNNKCGEVCQSKCEELVKRSDLPCRHVVKMSCSAEAGDCPHPCGVQLLCEHMCTGTCGKCQRGRIHMPCRQRCGRTLVCGHECPEPCTTSCPPCQKPCQNRCIHSQCKKKCGEPCQLCQEPCEWQCIHQRCTKPCGIPCNKKPCKMPCHKRLRKCNHPCIGLCGEPCPTKCRICNKDEVTEMLFGSEEEPDAHFVQLEDCQHVIEANALDDWMKMTDQSVTTGNLDIQLKACPKCKTVIRRNLRYGNIIKKMLADIEIVKKRMYGDEDQIKTRTTILSSKINRADISGTLPVGMSVYLAKQLKGHPTLQQVTLVENQFNLLSMSESVRAKSRKGITSLERISIKEQLLHLEQWLIKPRLRMSDQELEDISREMQRVSLMCQMMTIECRAKDRGRQDDLDVQVYLIKVKRILTDGLPLIDSKSQEAQRLLEKLGKHVGALPISEKERVSIVKAMDMTSGHWFKCRKGHIYVIGDCGGATVESTCPECKSRIGGTGHKLRDDNKFAPEMDNAAHPAWSDSANMANYQFD